MTYVDLSQKSASDKAKCINYLETNRRGFDSVHIDLTPDLNGERTWWVQFRKGGLKSRPAVHENLVHAVAIGLANWEEATRDSEGDIPEIRGGTGSAGDSV